MVITETVETKIVLRSKRKLTYEELRKRTEAQRLKGVTCRKGTVTEVDTYCSAAFCNGVNDREAIAH